MSGGKGGAHNCYTPFQESRRGCVQAAKSLGYSRETIDKLSEARTEAEIEHILADARMRKRDAEDRAIDQKLERESIKKRYPKLIF